ncbi:MAG: hypothetical protein K6C12_04350 [Oscillospiraceae bacterium]|nr:hypothetical protein [Oscillospiraceae bacterium]
MPGSNPAGITSITGQAQLAVSFPWNQLRRGREAMGIYTSIRRQNTE